MGWPGASQRKLQGRWRWDLAGWALGWKKLVTDLTMSQPGSCLKIAQTQACIALQSQRLPILSQREAEPQRREMIKVREELKPEIEELVVESKKIVATIGGAAGSVYR